MLDAQPSLSVLLARAQALAAAAGANEDRDSAIGAIADAVALRRQADVVLADLVDSARARGVTWQAIGDVLQISRQAAFQRFGHPVDPRTGEEMNTTPLEGSERVALTVVSDLAEARWHAVVDRFDAQMTAGLPAESLAAVWAHVVATVGAFEIAGEPSARRAADVTIVDVPLTFEAGEMTARITLRDDRSIAGLFVLDAEATS